MKILIYKGDALACLQQMKEGSVNCVVTSPPYWGLRDYGVEGQIGVELTLELYVARLVEVFHEMRRVLKADGTLWLNLGDSYVRQGGDASKSARHWDGRDVGEGRVDAIQKARVSSKMRMHGTLKPKDLVGVPWRVAFALQEDGWYLRADIIWHKPNPMPESTKDRPTKAHEYLFLLSKQSKYYYDAEAIQEPATYAGDQRGSRGDSRRGTICNSMSGTTGEFKNKRSVWTVATQPYKDAHFATFPPKLIEPCILAGCPVGGIVLDVFCGAGTTLLVADRNQRNGIGIELNPEYVEIARRRLEGDSPLFSDCTVEGDES